MHFIYPNGQTVDAVERAMNQTGEAVCSCGEAVKPTGSALRPTGEARQGHRRAHQLDEMEAVVCWLRESVEYIEQVAAAFVDGLRTGGRLYMFGNGGSASQAQHFATELTGRFRHNRRALPAQALNADGSLLTCIANDFEYTDVFSRQVEAFGRPGDIAIGLTTSGRSANVVRGLKTARRGGLRTVGFCGADDEALRSLCDFVIAVPSRDTARIQEGHLAVIHLLCETIDQAFR